MLYDMSCDALCFHNEWPVGTNPSCGPIYQQGRLERKAERHQASDRQKEGEAGMAFDPIQQPRQGVDSTAQTEDRSERERGAARE